MSRWDRDSFVSVIFRNIERGHEKNFDKKPKTTHGTRETPFDIQSVMMYESTAFGIVDKVTGKRMKTIQPLRAGVEIR